MSSYSLTEALKHSRHRTQQLYSLSSSVAATPVHKSRSEPAGISACPVPSRRRNDEIVSVPVRPWHSPCARPTGMTTTSPPSFSLESNGARQLKKVNLQNNMQHNTYLMASHLFMNDAVLNEDTRSVGTEICVSDTISQDPSVSELYLCERSACISHSNNCSNASRQKDGRRRQRNSRRHRGGDGCAGGRQSHQNPQATTRRGRNMWNLQPAVCEPNMHTHSEWPIISSGRGKSSRLHKHHQQQQQHHYTDMDESPYLMSNHLSGYFVNANCMADQCSSSQRSERTEPEFGCEDLKVRGQWQDSLSNVDSASRGVTVTDDDRTHSAELGSDLSALTLSHTELSSAQVAEPRRHKKANNNNPPAAESLGEASDMCSQEMQPVTYQQQMQVSHMPSSPMTSQPELQQPQQPQLQQVQQVQQIQPHQQQLLHIQSHPQQHQQPQPHPQQHQQPQPHHQQHQQPQSHHQQHQQPQPHHQQHQQPQPHHHQHQQYLPPQAMSRQPMSSVLANQQDLQVQTGRSPGSPPLASLQEASRPSVRRSTAVQNSSNSSFSLNQSELSTRESASPREEMIPASDDLVHLSVISCSEAGSRSEGVTTALGEADGEGDEAESTLRAESDRLALSLLAAEEAQQQQQQKQQQQQRLASLGGMRASLSLSDPAPPPKRISCPIDAASDTSDLLISRRPESRRPSRFGRLKTPEICKRSFLSVLRHSIAQGHISHRARMKAPAAIRSLAGN